MIIIINVVISIYISIITAQKTGSRSTSGGTTAETVASSTAPPARDTRSLDFHVEKQIKTLIEMIRRMIMAIVMFMAVTRDADN